MKKILLFLSLCIASISVFAQTRTITGTVVSSDKNEPLVGVTIQVKGSPTATQTDVNGKYALKVTSLQNVVLTVKYLGYAYQERTLRVGENNFDVKLVQSNNNLDDVVVVGYGEQKKATVTGSIATIKAKDVEDIPAGNLSSLLVGRLPGVSIGGVASGRPGVNTAINIRAASSFGGVTPTLFVIDGFVRDQAEGQAAFDRLDPSEVESISVLKDGAAAVYGARAAGGVVLVKTKRGIEGKAKISYAGSYGVNNPVKIPDMLSAYDLARLVNENLRVNSPNTYQANRYTDDELDAFRSLNYNWLDESFKNSTTQRHAVNIRGGSNKIGYFGSGTYYKELGNLKGTSYDKYTLRLGVDAEINKNLTASITLAADNNVNQIPYINNEQAEPMNLTFASLLQTPRWVPVYINGLPVGQNTRGLGIAHNVSAATNRNNYSRTTGNNTTLNASLNYKVPGVDGLKLGVIYNRNVSTAYNKSHRLNYTTYIFNTTGTNGHIITDQNPIARIINNGERLLEDYNGSNSYQLNGSISYDKKFGKHTINAIGLYEQSETSGQFLRAYRDGNLVPGDERQEGFNPASTTSSSNQPISSRLSYIGRVNYNYSEKYLLEASFRYEGSLRFSPENRWGFFPAVAAGWRISEESFFKDNVKFVNNLKLRLSAGLLGNDAIATRQYEQSYGVATSGYLGLGSTQLTGLNPRRNGLILFQTWEKTRNYNAGIDVGFTNNISATVDAYYKYTYDILTSRGSILPTSFGITSPPSENFGRASAWGVDGSVNYNGKVGKEFGYTVGINGSWGRNRVLEIYQSAGAIGTWEDQVGKGFGGSVGYIALGMMRSQAEVDAFMAANPGYTINGQPLTPGMIYYQDVGGPNYSGPDGKITADDQRIIAPDRGSLGFGINLGMTYKGFRINTNVGLNGIGAKTFYENDAIRPIQNTNAILNLPSFWSDFWSPENPNAAYPRPVNSAFTGERSTFWMRSAVTLNINTLDASYTLPANLTQKLGIPSLRLYFASRNLWRIINPLPYRDYALSSFVRYPTLRTFNFGLNIGL
ncbi:TonB-dependent receptor [uncultured Mucilaginibacter sp.]|uniref:SusC/RagA family TonB-linked outer membrane protein n=1 Tax=uncultured Mucilaginibacter sp. TaxID=797541 RepID=UPI0025DD3C91|nr:TonB-dependent receptor [uncultured Mucilaginibacter sp.]